MEREINLEKYRGDRSTLFTGRPQGRQVRKDLNLEIIDRENGSIIIFLIPNNTTSFNPSFYLGLLYDSYKSLGLDGFSKKYSFKIQEENLEIKKVLEKNLADGARNAINELTNKTGLKSFLDNK